MDRPLFSDMLADRRRQLGYSIPQAARVLRLREDVLVAFEEGDFEMMPKSGYAQGMLSSYARYLGLDASVIVDTYARDYERYRREQRRRGGSGRGSRRGLQGSMGTGVGQPYVGSRGLLPTSGGPAGDMGSFATTRVRTRSGSSPHANAGEEGYSYDGSSYPQGRPYTARTPSQAHRSGSSRSSRRRNDITTMDLEGYDDDLRLGTDATPYEAASTRRGRRSSRNISSARRPRTERQTDRNARRRGDRDRASGRRGQRGSFAESVFAGAFSHIGAIVAVIVVIALSLIIIFSANSCIRQDTDAARTVPVSEARREAKSSDTGSVSTDSSGSGVSSTSATSDATATSSVASEKETSVSVSVADGAVTWLEVECDGKSDVAQTITGPWQKTYTVEQAITIQAGDTTAVSVVQNGRQVQFESMASGIGSIRIQGSGKSASGTSSSNSSSSSSSAKSDGKDGTGDVDASVENGTGEKNETGKTATVTSNKNNTSSSSSSSSNGSSAKMGNAANGGGDGGGATQTGTEGTAGY